MPRKKSGKSKNKGSPGVFISNLISSDKPIPEKVKVKPEPSAEVSNNLEIYQEAVILRTVVELALANLLVGNKVPGLRPTQSKMAPPNEPSGSGFSKFISPVQDLGRSLLGFLIGSNQEPSTQTPGRRTNQQNNSKRDSIISTNSVTAGRQRPAGHPANPSTHSTPVVVRRIRTSNSFSKSGELDPVKERKNASDSHETSEPDPTKPFAAQRRKKKSRTEDDKVSPIGSVDNTTTSPVQPLPMSKLVSKQTPAPIKSISPNPPSSTTAKPPMQGGNKKRNRSSSNRRKKQAAKKNRDKINLNTVENVSGHTDPVDAATLQVSLDTVVVLRRKDIRMDNRESGVSVFDPSEVYSTPRTSLLIPETLQIKSNQINNEDREHVTSHVDETSPEDCIDCGEPCMENPVTDNSRNEKSSCENSDSCKIVPENLDSLVNLCEGEDNSVSVDSCYNPEIFDSAAPDNSCLPPNSKLILQSVTESVTAVNDSSAPDDSGFDCNSCIIPDIGSCEAPDSCESCVSDIRQIVDAGLPEFQDTNLPVQETTRSLVTAQTSLIQSHPGNEGAPGQEGVTPGSFGDSQDTQLETVCVQSYPEKQESVPPENTEFEPGAEVLDNKACCIGFISGSDKESVDIKPRSRNIESETIKENSTVVTELTCVPLSIFTPPTPPPPPPPGFLTENIKIPKIVSRAEKIKEQEGQSRKKKSVSREQALLDELSSLDESFACFLKTQLNIKTFSRERDSDSELGSNLDRRKVRRKKAESESSEGRPGSSLDIKPNSEIHQPQPEPPGLSLSVQSILKSEKEEKNCSVLTQGPSEAVETVPVESTELSPDPLSGTESPTSPAPAEDLKPMSETDPENEKKSEPCTDNVDVTNNNVVEESQCDESEILSKPDRTTSPSLVIDCCQDDMGGTHSSEEQTLSDVTSDYTPESKKVPILSKSDSGYSGSSPKSARKKDLSIDDALRQYNRRIGETVPVEQPKRQRIQSVGTEYSDYSDTDTELSDTEDVANRRGVREGRSFNSRRSSTDSSEDGAGLRDLRGELKELEDKFKKAMVANASLDNEKCQLMFQVDLLKDQVEEVEEQSSLILKELRAKTHDYELLKRDHAESQRAVQLLQAAMEAQQNMLQERGLVLLGGEEEEEEEEVGEDEQEKRTRAIVSQDTANILAGLGPGPLDVRIKRLARQRDDAQDLNRRLRLDLEEEQNLSYSARGANTQEEIERETKKLLDEYKFKISKCEQETATLTATVARLESQVIRFKTASETAELSEESLKVERRKTQRELRDAQMKNEELETANKHLEKRLEKLKTAKSNLLQQL